MPGRYRTFDVPGRYRTFDVFCPRDKLMPCEFLFMNSVSSEDKGILINSQR